MRRARLVAKPPEANGRPRRRKSPGICLAAMYTASGALPDWENFWRHSQYGLAPAMTPNCKIVLPTEKFRLEEINMPEKLASALAGQAVYVEVPPEALAETLRLDLDDLPDGLPFFVGDDGTAWNGYWPARVFYTDATGRTWRLPRHWLTEGVSPAGGDDIAFHVASGAYIATMNVGTYAPPADQNRIPRFCPEAPVNPSPSSELVLNTIEGRLWPCRQKITAYRN